MVIDSETYKLGESNYINVECIKTQIVLAQTFNHNMRHVVGWKNRLNGKTKKTAPFTISRDGAVFKHFDSKYLSRFFGDLEMDTKSIVILLENDGWLTNNDNNEFITWVGDIYSDKTDVVEKKWRGHNYWAPFTQKQFDSAINLVKILCEEYYIPKTIPNHNTKMDLLGYKGVIYKSNIDKHYTDLNPTWDFNSFKNKLEN